MSIEERIEKYYLDRIERYSKEIEEAFDAILVGDFMLKNLYKAMNIKPNVYDIHRNKYRPVFFASKNGVEYYLGGTPSNEEKEILEYLLDKMEREGTSSIVLSSNVNVNGEYLESSKFCFHNMLNETRYVGIDIFASFDRDGLNLDCYFISHFLRFLVESYDGQKNINMNLDCFLNNSDFGEGAKKIYFMILNTVAMQITLLLRNKGIYILDDPDDYNLELATGRYNMVNPKFISSFSNLIPIFLENPEIFIEMVGKDNFRNFIIYSLNNESNLDIDEIISKMKDEYVRYCFNIKEARIDEINFPIIFDSMKRLAAKRGEDISKFDSLNQVGLSSIQLEMFINLCLFLNAKSLDFLVDKAIASKMNSEDLTFLSEIRTNPKSIKDLCCNKRPFENGIGYVRVDSLYFTGFAYKLLYSFGERNDYYILETHKENFNFPYYVLLFNVNGEYRICDLGGYFYERDKDGVKDAEIRKHINQSVDDYFKNNNISETFVIEATGVDDDRPFDEIPRTSLEIFLKRNVRGRS